MIRSVIIEDEWLSQKLLLKRFKDHYPDIEIVAVIADIQEGVDFLKNNKVDLVLLDVNILGGTSFEILDKLPIIDFEIIYLTAHSEYAIEALNRGALHFILKPFKEEQFVQAIERFMVSYDQTQLESKIIITDGGNILHIRPSEIMYLESNGAYTHIHTQEKRYTTSKNLGTYETLLPPHIFLRCHNSFVINCGWIKKINKRPPANVVLENDVELPISKRRLKWFIETFQELKA